MSIISTEHVCPGPPSPLVFESEEGMRPSLAPDFEVTLTPQQVAAACAYYAKQFRLPLDARCNFHLAKVPPSPVVVKLWKDRTE